MKTVDADALWQRLIEQRNKNIEAGVPYTVNVGINQAVRILNETSKEVEQVVRCKDCKWYVTAPRYALYGDMPPDTKICRSPNLDYDTECGDQWMWMNPDDFCSYGERGE